MRKKVRLPDEPMNLDQFLEWLQEPPVRRHMQIIGDYAKAVEPDCQTVDQWNSFIRRNLRPAALLAPFSDTQIEKAMADVYEADYIKKWGLETLVKFLIK